MFTFAQIFILLQVFKTKTAINNFVLTQKALGKSMGLVPTMGALHAGHLSLLQKSKAINHLTIATIFVNPTQFNNPKDLENYPQPIILDIQMLKSVGCDVLFLPSKTEMYTAGEIWDYNLGSLANTLEGAYRQGHFKGVTQIVYKLFTVIPATMAFFGQKDFQQFLVVQQMVNFFSIPIKLECCTIIREGNGLAMSSRNIHLSNSQKKKALILIECLFYIKQNFATTQITPLLTNAKQMFIGLTDVKLEYLEICDKNTLQPLQGNNTQNAIALVAAFVGNTRLIDNMILD